MDDLLITNNIIEPPSIPLERPQANHTYAYKKSIIRISPETSATKYSRCVLHRMYQNVCHFKLIKSDLQLSSKHLHLPLTLEYNTTTAPGIIERPISNTRVRRLATLTVDVCPTGEVLVFDIHILSAELQKYIDDHYPDHINSSGRIAGVYLEQYSRIKFLMTPTLLADINMDSFEVSATLGNLICGNSIDNIPMQTKGLEIFVNKQSDPTENGLYRVYATQMLRQILFTGGTGYTIEDINNISLFYTVSGKKTKMANIATSLDIVLDEHGSIVDICIVGEIPLEVNPQNIYTDTVSLFPFSLELISDTGTGASFILIIGPVYTKSEVPPDSYVRIRDGLYHNSTTVHKTRVEHHESLPSKVAFYYRTHGDISLRTLQVELLKNNLTETSIASCVKRHRALYILRGIFGIFEETGPLIHIKFLSFSTLEITVLNSADMSRNAGDMGNITDIFTQTTSKIEIIFPATGNRLKFHAIRSTIHNTPVPNSRILSKIILSVIPVDTEYYTLSALTRMSGQALLYIFKPVNVIDLAPVYINKHIVHGHKTSGKISQVPDRIKATLDTWALPLSIKNEIGAYLFEGIDPYRMPYNSESTASRTIIFGFKSMIRRSYDRSLFTITKLGIRLSISVHSLTEYMDKIETLSISTPADLYNVSIRHVSRDSSYVYLLFNTALSTCAYAAIASCPAIGIDFITNPIVNINRIYYKTYMRSELNHILNLIPNNILRMTHYTNSRNGVCLGKYTDALLLDIRRTHEDMVCLHVDILHNVNFTYHTSATILLETFDRKELTYISPYAGLYYNPKLSNAALYTHTTFTQEYFENITLNSRHEYESSTLLGLSAHGTLDSMEYELIPLKAVSTPKTLCLNGYSTKDELSARLHAPPIKMSVINTAISLHATRAVNIREYSYVPGGLRYIYVKSYDVLAPGAIVYIQCTTTVLNGPHAIVIPPYHRIYCTITSDFCGLEIIYNYKRTKWGVLYTNVQNNELSYSAWSEPFVVGEAIFGSVSGGSATIDSCESGHISHCFFIKVPDALVEQTLPELYITTDETFKKVNEESSMLEHLHMHGPLSTPHISNVDTTESIEIVSSRVRHAIDTSNIIVKVRSPHTYMVGDSVYIEGHDILPLDIPHTHPIRAVYRFEQYFKQFILGCPESAGITQETTTWIHISQSKRGFNAAMRSKKYQKKVIDWDHYVSHGAPEPLFNRRVRDMMLRMGVQDDSAYVNRIIILDIRTPIKIETAGYVYIGETPRILLGNIVLAKEPHEYDEDLGAAFQTVYVKLDTHIIHGSTIERIGRILSESVAIYIGTEKCGELSGESIKYIDNVLYFKYGVYEYFYYTALYDRVVVDISGSMWVDIGAPVQLCNNVSATVILNDLLHGNIVIDTRFDDLMATSKLSMNYIPQRMPLRGNTMGMESIHLLRVLDINSIQYEGAMRSYMIVETTADLTKLVYNGMDRVITIDDSAHYGGGIIKHCMIHKQYTTVEKTLRLDPYLDSKVRDVDTILIVLYGMLAHNYNIESTQVRINFPAFRIPADVQCVRRSNILVSKTEIRSKNIDVLGRIAIGDRVIFDYANTQSFRATRHTPALIDSSLSQIESTFFTNIIDVERRSKTSIVIYTPMVPIFYKEGTLVVVVPVTEDRWSVRPILINNVWFTKIYTPHAYTHCERLYVDGMDDFKLPFIPFDSSIHSGAARELTNIPTGYYNIVDRLHDSIVIRGLYFGINGEITFVSNENPLESTINRHRPYTIASIEPILSEIKLESSYIACRRSHPLGIHGALCKKVPASAPLFGSRYVDVNIRQMDYIIQDTHPTFAILYEDESCIGGDMEFNPPLAELDYIDLALTYKSKKLEVSEEYSLFFEVTERITQLGQ